MPEQTLEQKRAMDAWTKSENCNKEYVNLVKGLPALIMNSGLMQTLAFVHEKGKKQNHYERLERHLLEWLEQRYPGALNGNFEDLMGKLMKAKPCFFQEVTTEAFAWLRWMRQMAAARNGGD